MNRLDADTLFSFCIVQNTISPENLQTESRIHKWEEASGSHLQMSWICPMFFRCLPAFGYFLVHKIHLSDFYVKHKFSCLRRKFGDQSTLRAVDPFDGAKPRLWRRGRKAPLRVNPEPLGLSSGRRQAPAFGSAGHSTQLMALSLSKGSPSQKPSRAKSRDRPESRRIDFKLGERGQQCLTGLPQT